MPIQTGTCAPPRGADQGVSLLVHGGAWDIPDEECDDHLDGLHAALERGRALLLDGAPALEVVAETVAVMEAHGAFDAGRGAVLNRDGEVELDAGLMDGETLAYGAVASVRRLPHPIRVARTLLEQGAGAARILAGAGAERFAAEHGFALVENHELICPRERARYERLKARGRSHPSDAFIPPSFEGTPQGTVGCVARDRAGRLAAATSTGGTPYRPPGRIGDSPLPGAGYYAADAAAASATGWGEAITAMLLCGRAVDRVALGREPGAVLADGLRQMHDRIRNPVGAGATGGLILMTRQGAGFWAFSTPRMARGGWQEGGEPWAEVCR